MGARRQHGQERALALALPWNMYKARFALIATVWFAQKEPKSLPRGTFHWLRIHLHCDCGRGAATDPADPLAVSKGSASQQRRNGRVDREAEEKNGETGEGMARKWRTKALPLLQEFLRAPTTQPEKNMFK